MVGPGLVETCSDQQANLSARHAEERSTHVERGAAGRDFARHTLLQDTPKH